MKVIVASTTVPFVDGGAMMITDGLSRALLAAGHQVETLNFPFDSSYPHMLDQMLGLRLFDLTQHGDRLIAIRPPSYLLRHPNKVVWFIHHHRGAYDLWGTRYQDIPDTEQGRSYRNAIMSADMLAFGESKRIFSNARVTADRLTRFNRVQAEVLYSPLPNPEPFHRGKCGDYVLYVSRLTHHKRQWLAIEALRCTKTKVKLVLAGHAAPGEQAHNVELHALVERYGLRDRVTILDRWISEEEKVKLFADCLAAVYMPYDEDSYGYPSLEAHHSSKPVVTTNDSGGTIELITDGVNGIVSDPEPESIARGFDRLYRDRAYAERLGAGALARLEELGINWETVVRKLLA